MAALAAVARGHDRLASLAPGSDHALDRFGRKVRAVREHDHRGLGVERGQAAAEGGSRPALPVRAKDDACVRLHLVGADDDDHVVDRRPPEAL